MRPDWDEYFLNMAHLASSRSPDEQTKVGCIIVNAKRHVVAMGYNGFPAGTKSDNLPVVRPHKYPYMIHAEQNAISNMELKGENLTAYVTARPCLVCSKLLWQNGVRRIVIDKNGVVYSLTPEDLKVLEFLIDNGLQIDYIGIDECL